MRPICRCTVYKKQMIHVTHSFLWSLVSSQEGLGLQRRLISILIKKKNLRIRCIAYVNCQIAVSVLLLLHSFHSLFLLLPSVYLLYLSPLIGPRPRYIRTGRPGYTGFDSHLEAHSLRLTRVLRAAGRYKGECVGEEGFSGCSGFLPLPSPIFELFVISHISSLRLEDIRTKCGFISGVINSSRSCFTAQYARENRRKPRFEMHNPCVLTLLNRPH